MIRIASAALVLAAASPAAAQSGPAPVEVGAWAILPATADSCQMVAAFGDHMMVSIVSDGAGAGDFVFSDDRWLLGEGDAQPGTISWDGWKTSMPLSFTASQLKSGRWALLAPTDASFTANLAGANHFWLRVPGVEFDDDFDVPDAIKPLTALATCNEKL